MAIKRLRRLEDNTPSVAEISRNVTEKKTFFRRIRLVTIVLALIVTAIILYYNYSPASGVVLIEEASVPLRAPVAAEIKWIVSAKTKEVHKGDLLATLFISSTVNVGISKDFLDRGMEADRVKFDMALTAMRFELESQRLEQEELRLKLEQKTANDEYQRAKIAMEKAQQIFELDNKQKDKAERLWNLDAISISDRQAAQRIYLTAEADLKSAILQYNESKSKSEFAAETLAQFKMGLDRHRQRLNEAVAASRKYLKSSSAAIGNIRELDSGYCIDLISPIDGMIVDRMGPEGTFVDKGETILTLYDPRNIRVYAYVKAIWRNRLKQGQEVRIKMDQDYVKTTISYVLPNLVAPPTQLRNQKMLSMENYYIKVELNRSPFRNVMPGQTGYAVFEKK